MEYLASIAHAFVSPVNCIANLGSEVLGAFGHFAQCVGQNLVGVSSTITNIPV